MRIHDIDNDDSETENDDSDSESDDRSDSDDNTDNSSDSDDNKPSRKVSKKKKTKVTRIRTDDDLPVLPPNEGRKVIRKLEKEGVRSALQDEMETLIKQLNSMSISDPNYGLLYYRAVKMDSDIAQIVRHPNRRLYEEPNGFRPTNRPMARSGSVLPMNREEMTCFGCGGKGHGIQFCPKINELLAQGHVIKNGNGMLRMKDGSRIPKQPTETFMEAIERIINPKSNCHDLTFILLFSFLFISQPSISLPSLRT